MSLAVVPVTTTYAGILGLYYLYLSINVIKERLAALCAVGDGSKNVIKKIIDAGKTGKSDNFNGINFDKYDKMVVAIRSHGNFSEFVPIIIILSLLLELNGVNGKLLHCILASVTFARISHVSGLYAKFSMGIGRRIGVGLTFTSLLITSLCCIYYPNKDFFNQFIKIN